MRSSAKSERARRDRAKEGIAGRVGDALAQVLPSPETVARAARWARRGLAAAFAAAAVCGSWEIRRRVSEDVAADLESWGIRAVSLPSWVTPEIRSEIEGVRLAGEERLSLFEAGVLSKIRERLEACPWIAEVSEVRIEPAPPGSRRAAGTVELALRLRAPVALVEHGGLYYLADAGGVRMGAPYRSAPVAWFRVPAIVSVPAPGPVPDEGERWSSRDVLQGIAVAKALAEGGVSRDFAGAVERIDLDNLHGRRDPRRPEIVLWAGGRRYGWGRSPISSGPRPVPVEAMVAALRRCLSDPSHLEGLSEVRLDTPGAPTGSKG